MAEKSPLSKEQKQEASSLREKLPSTTKKALTILWNDLPEWMRDNHYIQTGYRPPSNSYTTSFLSLGHLHNESVNIYTHLIGAVLALFAGSVMYVKIRPRYDMATREDILVFACFFLGAMGCLGMSATYHTISNHSEAVAKFGNRLDYIGIVVLIWGSFVPSIYYGFSAEPGLVRVYWTMVGVSTPRYAVGDYLMDMLMFTGRLRLLVLGPSWWFSIPNSGPKSGGRSERLCLWQWG